MRTSGAGPDIAATDSGLTWCRRPGEVAARVELPLSKVISSRGLTIEHGTRGLLLVDGGHARELAPGHFLPEREEGGFLGWIFRPAKRRDERLTVVLIDMGDLRVEAKVEQVFSNDPLPMRAELAAVARVSDLSRFYVNVMKSSDVYSLDDLCTAILPELRQALFEAVSDYPAHDLIARPQVQEAIEPHLQIRMRTQLEPRGLRVERVGSLTFHEAPPREEARDDREPSGRVPAADIRGSEAYREWCRLGASSADARPNSRIAPEAPDEIAGTFGPEAASLYARFWAEEPGEVLTRTIYTVPSRNQQGLRIGDAFVPHVQSDRDCYLTLLNFGTDGSVGLLLTDLHLHGGAPVALRGPDGAREWRCGPPEGIERFKALFCIDPLELFPEASSRRRVESALGVREALTDLGQAICRLGTRPQTARVEARSEFILQSA